MFNFPNQVGRESDPPTSGEDREHNFENGDVIVMYSDGMSDNLYNSHFIPCVQD